jgi:N-acetylneuraminic acid mutarotase
MITARSCFGTTINVQTKEIYAVGGLINTIVTAKCEVYNPQTNQWRELPSLNVARGASTVCLVGKHLYCIGGYTAINGQTSVL